MVKCMTISKQRRVKGTKMVVCALSLAFSLIQRISKRAPAYCLLSLFLSLLPLFLSPAFLYMRVPLELFRLSSLSLPSCLSLSLSLVLAVTLDFLFLFVMIFLRVSRAALPLPFSPLPSSRGNNIFCMGPPSNINDQQGPRTRNRNQTSVENLFACFNIPWFVLFLPVVHTIVCK